MHRCAVSLLAAIGLSAFQLSAQTSPPQPPPRPISSGGGGGGNFWEWHWSLGALSRRGPVVTGAAYSADHIVEVPGPPLPGATGVRQMTNERLYRDAEGRTRAERQPPAPPRPNGLKFPPLVEIHDPVAGVAYVLDMEAGVAHRVAMDPAPATRGPVSSPPPRVTSLPPAQGPGVEDLGDQVMEGLVVHGTRRTVTLHPPPGRGDGTPSVQVTETWYSPDLRLDILIKTTSSSVTTQKCVNISRDEPSTLLFQPPAEFRIVDETGAGVSVSYVAQ